VSRPADDRDEERGRDRQPGPVPVRDLMKRITPEPEAEGEPRWEGEERTFEADGVVWSVRPAGAGKYGTGDLGTARLLAVHFYREDVPGRPQREALIAAARFESLRPEELRELYDRATPIELDD
jgi:hypothetical protein